MISKAYIVLFENLKIWDNLSIFLSATALIALMIYFWQMRKLYALSWKLNGPFAWPFFGNILELCYNLKCLTTYFIKLGSGKWGETSKMWLLNRLLLITTDPNKVYKILNTGQCLHKPDVFFRFFRDLAETGLFTAKVEDWKFARKIINPAFNQKLVNSFMEVFNEKAQVLNELMEEKVGQEFDIFHNVCNCTMDIIMESIMDTKLDVQRNGSVYLDIVTDCLQLAMKRITNPLLRPDFIYWNIPKYKIKSEWSFWWTRGYVSDVIEEKRQEMKELSDAQNNYESGDASILPKRKAFLQHLIEINKFTDPDLVNQVGTFIVAGSDTSGTVDSHCLVLLALYPDVQARVYAELEEIFGDSDRPVTLDDLPRMEYMEMVLKETMRLIPVTMAVTREVIEDTQLDDLLIPKGTILMVHLHGLHRNPAYWKDPEIFDPDRFLPEEVSKRHPYAYVPFSTGPRNCIGRQFAMMSMKVVIATVLRKYKLTTSYKTLDDLEFEWHMITKLKSGCNVTLELRKP